MNRDRRSTVRFVLPIAVVAFAAGVAACGGSRSAGRTGPIAVAEKGRAQNMAAGTDDQSRCEYRGREDREVSETAGPGAILPNVRRVYQVIGTGDDRRKVLACREIDTNLDGVKDVIRVFNDKGEAMSEQADANYDGKIDTWITFSNGRISKVALDEDGDGQPEIWKYYVGGQLSRIQRDTNKDGKPDVWEFYARGHLERMGVDLDFDGKVDRWDHDEQARRQSDAADKAEERGSGGARVDPNAPPPPPPPAASSASTPPPASSSDKPKSKQQRDKDKPKK